VKRGDRVVHGDKELLPPRSSDGTIHVRADPDAGTPDAVSSAAAFEGDRDYFHPVSQGPGRQDAGPVSSSQAGRVALGRHVASPKASKLASSIHRPGNGRGTSASQRPSWE
jgi:hypothetical protein